MRRAILAILSGVAVSTVVGAVFVYTVWRVLPASVPLSGERLIAEGATFAVLGVPGVVVAVLIDRRRDHPRGHCRACGYNLRGNVSGVCSECGEAA